MNPAGAKTVTQQQRPSSTAKVMTLQAIGEIDKGRVALAFNHAMRLVGKDIGDRPGDPTKRKVIFTVELRPVIDKDTGALDEVENEFTVAVSVPKRRSAPYPMVLTDDGRQLFQPGSPFDPRQDTFSFVAAPPPEGVNPDTGEIAGDADDDNNTARM
jgi:hypothetical protein